MHPAATKTARMIRKARSKSVNGPEGFWRVVKAGFEADGGSGIVSLSSGGISCSGFKEDAASSRCRSSTGPLLFFGLGLFFHEK